MNYCLFLQTINMAIAIATITTTRNVKSKSATISCTISGSLHVTETPQSVTYIAALADGQGCLSIQSLHSLSPCSSAASLLLKIGPRMRLISTIESRRRLARKIIPCEHQSCSVAKIGIAEPSIRNPLYRSIPIA